MRNDLMKSNSEFLLFIACIDESYDDTVKEYIKLKRKFHSNVSRRSTKTPSVM